MEWNGMEEDDDDDDDDDGDDDGGGGGGDADGGIDIWETLPKPRLSRTSAD